MENSLYRSGVNKSGLMQTLSNPMQLDLFQDSGDALCVEPEIVYLPDLVQDHKDWFTWLNTNITWNIRFKSRKTVTFGVSWKSRIGIRKHREMPDFMNPLCEVINQAFGFWPNNCLINNYPDGNHYISYHSDQNLEMEENSGVAIISLGATREMALRNIEDPSIKYYYSLQPGSAIYMDDNLQTVWQHGILKQSGSGHRISLSFRLLKT